MNSDDTVKKGNGKKKGQRKPKGKSFIIGILIAILVFGVGGYFTYTNFLLYDTVDDVKLAELMENGTFANGINVGGVDVSGKNYAEAKAALESVEKTEKAKISYTLSNEYGSVVLTGDDFSVSFDTEDVLKKALKFGLEGNVIDRATAAEQLKTGKGFDVTMTINKEETLSNIHTKISSLSLAAQEPTITISSDMASLTYVEGKQGHVVDTDALDKLINEQLDAGNLVAAITAPTKIVEPTSTVDELKQNSALISSFSTTYTGTANRIKNIQKAAGLLNGLKVDPGQTISVNDILGPRTLSNGWYPAPAIVEGQHVDEPGGGVCQVATTLYNALLMADMTIVKRSPHSIKSAYVPIGRDATISTGGPDLVFRNDGDHAVFIFAKLNTKNNTLTFKIYGEPLADGVTINVTSTQIAVIQPTATEQITIDNTQPTTYNNVLVERSVGYKSQTFKQYIKDGTVIKTVLVSTDTYPARAGKRIVGGLTTITTSPTVTSSVAPTTTP